MLRYDMCLRIQHTSKECCVHSKTFFQGKTCSKYYCIYPFERIQSFKKCSIILCNMSDTLSKEYCIHLRTFFTGKTLSKYDYCIYWCILLHRNSTFFYILLHRSSTFFYIILILLFESNTASNEGLSLQVRFFQSPAASIKALCYKAMLHVLK